MYIVISKKIVRFQTLFCPVSNIFLADFKHFLALLWSPILRETLLTNMTNDVAGNDAAYCSIRKKVEQFLIFATKPCQEINFHQIYQNLSKSYPIIWGTHTKIFKEFAGLLILAVKWPFLVAWVLNIPPSRLPSTFNLMFWGMNL